MQANSLSRVILNLSSSHSFKSNSNFAQFVRPLHFARLYSSEKKIEFTNNFENKSSVKNPHNNSKGVFNNLIYRQVNRKNFRILTTQTNKDFDVRRGKIGSANIAREFINTLTPNERLILKDELTLIEAETLKLQTG